MQLYTTTEAADHLNVPAAAIRKWRHRGQAMPAGMLPATGGQQPLWRLEELQPLADRYHHRGVTRRGPKGHGR